MNMLWSSAETGFSTNGLLKTTPFTSTWSSHSTKVFSENFTSAVYSFCSCKNNLQEVWQMIIGLDCWHSLDMMMHCEDPGSSCLDPALSIRSIFSINLRQTGMKHSDWLTLLSQLYKVSQSECLKTL